MTDSIETPTAPAPDNLIVIARQAILDAKRAVYGYELFDRSTTVHEHTATTDAAVLFNALAYAGAETLIGRNTVFINCTHESLVVAHLELIHPDKVVLEVPVLAPDASAEEIESKVGVLQALKDRGFRIALDQNAMKRAYVNWLPLASFIKLDMQAFKPELAEPLVKFAHSQCPKATLVAEKVESPQQYERMAGLGVTLFQGYWFVQPTEVKAQTIRPSQATVLQLINLVRKQADVDEIEQLLKKDPTLSFNLLRFINSSGFGLSMEITSFRHAVMILGLKKLFRWAALLLTTSRNTGTPLAVGQTAVVRGRLMELLAAEMLPPEESDHAFVVGVFSLLDVMLGVPLDRALESVSLPASVVDALLRNQGVFAPFLELTRACESGDEAAFARAAEQLHMSGHQINMAHMQALTWADDLLAGGD